MRRAIPRITRPLLRRPAAPHPTTPCLASCRQFSITAHPAEKTQFSWQDSLRRKLWGDNTPPVEPTTAAPAEKAPVGDRTGYVEAIDARDLRIVGLTPGLSEWDVPAFLTNTRFENPEAIVRAVYRAIIEVHTHALNNAPHPPTLSYTGPENLTVNVLITLSPAGDVTFNYQLPEIESGILTGRDTAGGEVRAYTEDEVYPAEEGEEEERPEWLAEGLEKRGWAEMGIGREVLFALVKRVTQLTGRRIPDAEVSRMKTVADLLEYMEFKPKPKKLYETLVESELPALPNVKVFGSRVRPWDKEKVIGRERPFEKVVEFKYPFEEEHPGKA